MCLYFLRKFAPGDGDPDGFNPRPDSAGGIFYRKQAEFFSEP